MGIRVKRWASSSLQVKHSRRRKSGDATTKLFLNSFRALPVCTDVHFEAQFQSIKKSKNLDAVRFSFCMKISYNPEPPEVAKIPEAQNWSFVIKGESEITTTIWSVTLLVTEQVTNMCCAESQEKITVQYLLYWNRACIIQHVVSNVSVLVSDKPLTYQ